MENKDESPAKILVVDDEERVRKIIGLQLQKEGYEVSLLECGEDAVAQLGNDHYDLLITDIRMPKMSGFDVLAYSTEHAPLTQVIMLTGVVEIETAVNVMQKGAIDYLIKPVKKQDLLKAVEKALAYGRLVRYNQQLEQENLRHQQQLEADVEKRTHELSNALAQLTVVHMDTVRILSGAIEEKDPYIRGHANRVRHMAHHIAAALGYTQRQLDMLDFGALLHDVGKIAIDSRILNKPAELSPDERKIVETHPLVGERIVSKVSYFSEIVPVIRWHHERWDGNGYPDGLEGGNIPKSARILAVVDTFDAMTSDRAYRLALSTDRALDIICKESGKQFDPEMVDVFLREKTHKLVFEGE